jgi:hypothetical protein
VPVLGPLYFSATNSTSAAAGKQLVTVNPNAVASDNVTTSGATPGWFNHLPRGGTATVVASQPAFGDADAVFVHDSTVLEGKVINAGTITVSLQQLSNPHSNAASWRIRAGIRHSDGTYTQLSDQQSLSGSPSTNRNGTVTLTIASDFACVTGDRFCIDIDVQQNNALATGQTYGMEIAGPDSLNPGPYEVDGLIYATVTGAPAPMSAAASLTVAGAVQSNSANLAAVAGFTAGAAVEPLGDSVGILIGR